MISQRPGWLATVGYDTRDLNSYTSMLHRVKNRKDVNTSWQRNVCPVMRSLWSCRLFFLVVRALSSYLPHLDASQFHASIMSLPNENLAGPLDFNL